MMRVIVCGGRDYADRERLFAVLDNMHRRHRISEVIEGGATGADAMAGEWATERGINLTVMPADWKGQGKRAGPLRNRRMLDLHPDMVIAFKGGRGTAHMKAIAKAADIAVYTADVSA